MKFTFKHNAAVSCDSPQQRLALGVKVVILLDVSGLHKDSDQAQCFCIALKALLREEKETCLRKSGGAMSSRQYLELAEFGQICAKRAV